MQFAHTYQQVLDGTKTQTRRIVKTGMYTEVGLDEKIVAVYNSNTRVRYRVGSTYAVQPGRAQSGIGRIRLLAIRQEDVRRISASDALAEGAASPREFLDLWESMHGNNYDAWVLEFELVNQSQ
jgi:hypothetical protein